MMANPLVGGMPNMGGMNPMAMLAQLRNNPLGVLKQAGFNLPDNMNDPQAIIQHLMNSGQVSQQQLNNAQQMAGMFGMKR